MAVVRTSCVQMPPDAACNGQPQTAFTPGLHRCPSDVRWQCQLQTMLRGQRGLKLRERPDAHYRPLVGPVFAPDQRRAACLGVAALKCASRLHRESSVEKQIRCFRRATGQFAIGSVSGDGSPCFVEQADL